MPTTDQTVRNRRGRTTQALKLGLRLSASRTRKADVNPNSASYKTMPEAVPVMNSAGLVETYCRITALGKRITATVARTTTFCSNSARGDFLLRGMVQSRIMSLRPES
jgi:hypothetical protein